MTIKVMGQIIISVLSFSAGVHMAEAAEQPSVQDTQSSAKWMMTLDEGDKPLGECTPFVTMKPGNQSQILQIRFDIGPYKSSVANLFSDAQHQNNFLMAISAGPSLLGLYVKASNNTELNKTKGIIDFINSQVQKEFDDKRAKCEKGTTEYLVMTYSKAKLPFTFASQQYPNCIYAFLELPRHKYLGDFIEQFQNVFPELRSEVLDGGYSELARRIVGHV